jgi:hypothetical protein
MAFSQLVMVKPVIRTFEASIETVLKPLDPQDDTEMFHIDH